MDTTQRDTFLHLIGVLVGFVGVACVALAAIYVLRLDMLPAKYAIPIFAVDAFLALLPLYFMLSGKQIIKKWLCIFLSALMAALNLFVVSYGGITYDFLNEQYGSSAIGNVEYSVIAQTSSQIDLQQSAKRTFQAGVQSTDIFKTEAEDEFQKLAPAEFSEYDSISDLVDATEYGWIELAVVQTIFLDTFAEYFPESYEKLSVLTTFRAGEADAANAADDTAIDFTKPFAVFVSGADDYGDIDQTARSDVNMLVLIDPEHYRMMLVNTPRDYYVQLHDTTGLPDKLTHAGTYGIDVSEATLEDLYGINIDYHVHVNYDTLIKLIDRLGGIVVDNPVAFSYYEVHFDAGEIYMDGAHALWYVRTRKGLTGDDNARGENQQRVIEAIVNRVSFGAIAAQYPQILDELTGTFRSNIPPAVIAQLFKRQISLGGHWTIEKLAVTGTTSLQPTYSMGSDRPLDVMLPDQDSVAEVSAQMKMFLRGEDPQAQVPADSGAAPDPAVE